MVVGWVGGNGGGGVVVLVWWAVQKTCRPLVVRCEVKDITLGSYPGWWW